MNITICLLLRVFSILAIPASVLEDEDSVLVHAVVGDCLIWLQLYHLRSFHCLVNPHEYIKALWLTDVLQEHFGVDHESLGQ